MRLKGKVAVVTGAGSGFGEAIARLYAEEGAAVVIDDLDETAAKRVADTILQQGGKAVAIRADVTKSADTKAMVDRALASFGRLDILVNNAGFPQRNQPMTGVSEQDFDRIFAVNVKSIYWAAIHAVPVMKKQGGGVIINTASTAAGRPRPGLTWYNGSKGAVVTITRSMAVELAPDKIRVNAINPVAGETPMLSEFMGGAVTPEMRARFVATVPLGRLSQPLDIANAALFLASEDAAFLTGVCLDVDGGRSV